MRNHLSVWYCLEMHSCPCASWRGQCSHLLRWNQFYCHPTSSWFTQWSEILRITEQHSSSRTHCANRHHQHYIIRKERKHHSHEYYLKKKEKKKSAKCEPEIINYGWHSSWLWCILHAQCCWRYFVKICTLSNLINSTYFLLDHSTVEFFNLIRID